MARPSPPPLIGRAIKRRSARKDNPHKQNPYLHKRLNHNCHSYRLIIPFSYDIEGSFETGYMAISSKELRLLKKKLPSYGKKGPESQLLPYDQIQTKLTRRFTIINMKILSHEWLHDFLCTL